MQNPARLWIIAGLTHKPLPALSNVEEHFDKLSELMIEVAENEGVLLLLEYQLHSHPQRSELPDVWMQRLQAACQQSLFDQLAMLAEQTKVFEALQNAGVDFLVLKGGALAHWLYAKPHLRVVTDLDILLPSKQDVFELNKVLASIGYHTEVAAGELISYEHPFRKPGGPFDNYTVDAHWRLFNSALLQDRFDYAQLRSEAVSLPNKVGAHGLSPVHALFNACGHFVMNLPNTQTLGLQNPHSLRWQWDIHAIAISLNESQWLAVINLAQQKQMSAVILHALNTVQSVFNTVIPNHVLTELSKQQSQQAMSINWFTRWPRYQWHVFLASSPHWRGRGQWLWQRVWPNPDAMRQRYGSDDPVWKFMLKRFWVGIKRLLS